MILISGQSADKTLWIRRVFDGIDSEIRAVDYCPEFPDCLSYVPDIIIYDMDEASPAAIAQIARRIKVGERYELTSVIFCGTSFPDDPFLRDEFAIGRIEFIKKPVLTEILSGRVRSLQDQRRFIMGLEKRLEDLNSSNRELMLLNVTTAHDLKQPLNAIIGFVDLLTQNGDRLDAQSIKYIDFIKRSSQNMYGIVSDLLKHSRRFRNSVDELRLERVNMNELLNNIAYDFAINDSREIKIIADPLPVIRCEKLWISSVFKNIIGNGLKYNRSREPRIRIGCSEDELEYSFFIKDNGIGISGEDLEKIFEPFVRLSNSEDFEGSGAGLYIVKYAIEKHGGRVWAEINQDGDGTTFRFTIRKYLD